MNVRVQPVVFVPLATFVGTLFPDVVVPVVVAVELDGQVYVVVTLIVVIIAGPSTQYDSPGTKLLQLDAI